VTTATMVVPVAARAGQAEVATSHTRFSVLSFRNSSAGDHDLKPAPEWTEQASMFVSVRSAIP